MLKNNPLQVLNRQSMSLIGNCYNTDCGDWSILNRETITVPQQNKGRMWEESKRLLS